MDAKRFELGKEVPRFMVAVGAEPAPCSQEGRGTGGKDRVPPHAAPAQISPALLAGGEKGFCLCMGKVVLTACATAERGICY